MVDIKVSETNGVIVAGLGELDVHRDKWEDNK